MMHSADMRERVRLVLITLKTQWVTLTGKKTIAVLAASGFGNIYLEYEPITDLVIRSSIGGNYNSFYSWNYFGRQYENSENNSRGNLWRRGRL